MSRILSFPRHREKKELEAKTHLEFWLLLDTHWESPESASEVYVHTYIRMDHPALRPETDIERSGRKLGTFSHCLTVSPKWVRFFHQTTFRDFIHFPPNVLLWPLLEREILPAHSSKSITKLSWGLEKLVLPIKRWKLLRLDVGCETKSFCSSAILV
jgi:hypothetical protein